MRIIALFGAAGKIGTRISNALRGTSEGRVLFVESGEAGLARLRERGLTAADPEQAAHEADVVIIAIPDVAIGQVARSVVPMMKSGAMLICLDPAAPHGGELPDRSDIAYFVTHPCHPPIVHTETETAAQLDFWGGVARQDVVCALMQGGEEDYATGERIAKLMFAPIANVYRVTVEQMAILEPALAETIVLTCQVIIKEAVDEAVKQGVPEVVARAFVLGHMKVNLGILFGYIDAKLSDGALLALDRGKAALIRPGWQRTFEPDRVLEQVKAITEARSTPRRAEAPGEKSS